MTDGYWREYPWTVKVDPDAATRQMLEVEIAEGFNKGIKRIKKENHEKLVIFAVFTLVFFLTIVLRFP